MLRIDQLYAQKMSELLNLKINHAFNDIIKKNPILGNCLAFFVILAKCFLHTLSLFVNTLEYALRGFFYLFSSKAAMKEYFSTLGSFLVINTINIITVIPDIFIRSYYVLKESKIDPIQTKHTLYYQIMRLI